MTFGPAAAPEALCVLVETTVATRAQAQALARLAVGGRFAACAQIVALESVYRWQEAVRAEPEYRVSFKTSAQRQVQLMAAVHAAHPYELPQLTVVALADCDPDYARWVVENVSASPD